jgi:hypothetical protein
MSSFKHDVDRADGEDEKRGGELDSETEETKAMQTR